MAIEAVERVDHILAVLDKHGGELRRHAKVASIVVADGRVQGVALADGDVITAPVVVSNLDPTATFTQLLDRDDLPPEFARRVDAIDHRAAYYQVHFALNGLPEYRSPYEILNEGDVAHNVTFFGTAEEMQRDYEGCLAGVVPAAPSFNIQIPSRRDPGVMRAWYASVVSPALAAAPPLEPHSRSPRRAG